ncbi:hypothetical protein BS1321_20645 [Peribacillus simplex NBRC 15720 = DSM 1321]|uniref:Uncharacterized protein n=1 Tax=Peribacillus simplex NBRC 15720 = DSM 1321 TaxID=1349754 RepID=A0A223ELK5_9BACI|nr:hypothetical protein BS1321_20645 [Peribacillus simplex NBRC 15720 = DSM 1321]
MKSPVIKIQTSDHLRKGILYEVIGIEQKNGMYKGKKFRIIVRDFIRREQNLKSHHINGKYKNMSTLGRLLISLLFL